MRQNILFEPSGAPKENIYQYLKYILFLLEALTLSIPASVPLRALGHINVSHFVGLL